VLLVAAASFAETVLQSADLGRGAKVALGERFEVRLPENPTTGYQWAASWSPKANLVLVDSRFVPDAGPDVIGGGGMRHFAFRAAAAGQVALMLQYGQSWTGGSVDKPKITMISIAGKASEAVASDLPVNPGKGVVRVTKADFGKTINLGPRDKLEVVLTENPSTGYSWRCTWDPVGSLRVVRSDYVTPATSPGIVGAPGQRRIVLKPCSAGATVLTLQYGRWWEGGERDPANTITVQVAP
jgi:inhibitor of cysteine peptidase